MLDDTFCGQKRGNSSNSLKSESRNKGLGKHAKNGQESFELNMLFLKKQTSSPQKCSQQA